MPLSLSLTISFRRSICFATTYDHLTYLCTYSTVPSLHQPINVLSAYHLYLLIYLLIYFQDDCGEWVTALCPYGTTGCLDNEGDYDIIMPEPPHKTQRNYKVQVFDLVSGQSGCSHAFSLVPETEVPTRDDPDGPFLSVVSPMENDGAVAGETYTVEVSVRGKGWGGAGAGGCMWVYVCFFIMCPRVLYASCSSVYLLQYRSTTAPGCAFLCRV